MSQPSVTAVLNAVQRRAAREDIFLQRSTSQFLREVRAERNENEDINIAIISRFVTDGGSEAIRVLTNFFLTELDVVWTEGRGRKSNVKPKDAFFMLLTVLKHYETWEKHAVDFGFKTATFEKLIVRVLNIVEPILFAEYVRALTMEEVRSADNGAFEHYPYALYATDVKFQPGYRPNGRHIEAKHYFSPKHGLYGRKIECSVSPLGIAVDISPFHPESVHDITIMLGRVSVHEALLQRDEQADFGELATRQGYTGHLRVIVPKRKPSRGRLDAMEIERNEKISTDRVIVENFFGRVCQLWKISYASYTGGEKLYDLVQRTTFALSNFHLSLMPLRVQDREFYDSVLARYICMRKEKKMKRAESQKRHRATREHRLNLDRNLYLREPLDGACRPVQRRRSGSSDRNLSDSE